MFDWGAFSDIGFGGALVAILVFLIVSLSRGWLIPASSHKREIEAERRNTSIWKEVAAQRQATIASLSVQNTAMLETTRTTEALVKALPAPHPNGGQ